MIKKFALPIFLTILLGATVPLFQFINSQSIIPVDQGVSYELPYPGILPDHPLYFLKSWRDRASEFLTRDNLRKADLYILLSDKDVGASQELAQKGKNKLAIDTLLKGEKYEARIPEILKRLKQQGATSSPEFINKIKDSNAKHRQVIDQLIKEIPTGDQQNIEDIMKLNERVKSETAGL